MSRTKANELMGQLISQRLETVTELIRTNPENLNLRNPEGQTMRSVIRKLNDHEMSHLVQIAKTRQALGITAGEMEMVLAQTVMARAALAAAMAGLDDEHLDLKPSDDEWSIREIIDHVVRYDPLVIERVRTQFEPQG